jgi:hypothetical protein
LRPFAVIAREGVGEDDELSHDRGEGDLCGLSGFDHGVVFGFAIGIEFGGAEGWHVEGSAGS